MKVFLMHPNRDAGFSSANAADFAEDLALDVLLDAAAAGDRHVYGVMTAACVDAWQNDAVTVLYRQEVLKDCLTNPSLLRQFYAISLEPFGRERGWEFSLFGQDPSSMLSSSVRTLRGCLGVLRRLRNLCLRNAASFASEGFRQFFGTLERNLDDAYLDAANADLKNLAFQHGILLSAQVGAGGKGAAVKLRKPLPRDLSWINKMLSPWQRSLTLQLHPRDEAGGQAFSELQNRGLALISEALYQSAEHVLSFLKALRAELSFYIGCLNLYEALNRIGETVAFPEPSTGKRRLSCRNLRDVCLALTMERGVVGNDVDGDGKALVIITGANRGGKSTFLRSIGIAQLMMQCGMFVTADTFVSSLHTGLFTHYKRSEDRSMRSGKFDEELGRMSAIANRIHRGAIVLFNESFAATNEREGAEIARQIILALLENEITVFFVSHMYELARLFQANTDTLFLRAERADDGTRSFRLRAAKPLQQSYGADLYNRIFG